MNQINNFSIISMLILALMSIMLSACGEVGFAGSEPALLKNSDGSLGTTDPVDTDPASDEEDLSDNDDCDNDNDDTDILPTVPEFLDLIVDAPEAAALIAKEARCYISGGGGHGVDVCLSGDKTPISGLQPIEIRGDQLCVPLPTVQANPDLFAAGILGECADTP